MNKLFKGVYLLYLLLHISSLDAQTYYVDTGGSNTTGNGSNTNPWLTITHALSNVQDGSTIMVNPGTYVGIVYLVGSFSIGVSVISTTPYMAKLRYNDGAVVRGYINALGCHGITLDGFDIAHQGTGASPLVLHFDGDSTGAVHDLTIQNCIIHDSYNNDLAKINNSCYNITIQGNMFFNQAGSDEHIDGNSVENLIIQDNIFFNDFASSGRTNNNNTSSFIVVKDSGGDNDLYLGSNNVKIRRNVFLNWEGSSGTNFILLGEDGEPYYEAYDVMIENNLMIGNSSNYMRAPFGIKGCKDVTFRNNTIVGNLNANAFAFRFNLEQQNLINDNIHIYNNIWSDPTGTMNDFSDCPLTGTDNFWLDNNLYWNDGTPIPTSSSDLINITDDLNSLQGNPLLGSQGSIVIPHFNSNTNLFQDGSTSIQEAFVNLVNNYGTPTSGSIAINAANENEASSEDILGNPRVIADIGAVEYDSSLSFEEEDKLKFSIFIYPNPFEDQINILLPDAFVSEEVQFQLWDVSGRLIMTSTNSEIVNSIIMIDVSEVSSGIYFVKLFNAAGKSESIKVYKK